MTNLFKKNWQKMESPATRPRCLRDIKILPFAEFRQMVIDPTETGARRLVESLYAGDAYILKEAFSRQFMEDLIDRTFAWAQEIPSEFHPMLEGCPDYHKIIDQEATKKFSYDAIRHSHFFFPWNGDPLGCYEAVYERWRVFKYLGGFAADIYEKNTPVDGIVDRLQVARYPAGGGGLEAHVDPFINQRVIIGAMMSKRGVDYSVGGFYCVNSRVEKVDFEEYLDVGDMVCCYPTVVHGVDPVDPQLPIDWKSKQGRWFLGLYSNDSNHVKNRNTTVPLTDINEYIANRTATA